MMKLFYKNICNDQRQKKVNSQLKWLSYAIYVYTLTRVLHGDLVRTNISLKKVIKSNLSSSIFTHSQSRTPFSNAARKSLQPNDFPVTS